MEIILKKIIRLYKLLKFNGKMSSNEIKNKRFIIRNDIIRWFRCINNKKWLLRIKIKNNKINKRWWNRFKYIISRINDLW